MYALGHNLRAVFWHWPGRWIQLWQHLLSTFDVCSQCRIAVWLQLLEEIKTLLLAFEKFKLGLLSAPEINWRILIVVVLIQLDKIWHWNQFRILLNIKLWMKLGADLGFDFAILLSWQLRWLQHLLTDRILLLIESMECLYRFLFSQKLATW